eukprot:1157395-Pelagomonas_calceolata.AAC.7
MTLPTKRDEDNPAQAWIQSDSHAKPTEKCYHGELLSSQNINSGWGLVCCHQSSKEPQRRPNEHVASLPSAPSLHGSSLPVCRFIALHLLVHSGPYNYCL